MKYKLLSVSLGIICILLGINYYKVQKQLAAASNKDCGHTEELDKLRFEKTVWQQRETEFLSQNGFLVTENNELKMQLEHKPKTIYRNAKNPFINRNASDMYTSLLSKRYNNPE